MTEQGDAADQSSAAQQTNDTSTTVGGVHNVEMSWVWAGTFVVVAVFGGFLTPGDQTLHQPMLDTT